jgi:sterol 3beta-glucosyltransferase
MNRRVGSQGDILPYVALGIGLKQAGFEVKVATDPNFSLFVTNHALDFAPIHAPFAQLMQTDAGKVPLIQRCINRLKR